MARASYMFLGVALLALLAQPSSGLLFGSIFNLFKPPVAPAPAPAPVTNFITGVPKYWVPKTAANYDPTKVDWAGLVSACRAVVRYEKRLGNFWVRVSFHDSLSVNVTTCLNNPAACGGADASSLLNMEEMLRPENNYDGFSRKAARVSYRLAAHYDCSMADVIAVGAACAVEIESKDRIKFFGGAPFLRVGRLDSKIASQPGLLPPAEISVVNFNKFFIERGFSPKEAAALLGSHSLIDDQGCTTNDFLGQCTPLGPGSCADVRMFRWENHYFRDVCKGQIQVRPRVPADADPPVKSLPFAEFVKYKNLETCKFTSELYRLKAKGEADRARAGFQESDPPSPFSVDWTVDGVKRKWFYTVNDAFLGQTCQANPASLSGYEFETNQAYNLFRVDQGAWDATYKDAYNKMVTKFANFINPGVELVISGRECASAYRIDTTCSASLPLWLKTGLTCTGCSSTGTGSNCHSCCRCGSAFIGGVAYKPFPILSLLLSPLKLLG